MRLGFSLPTPLGHRCISLAHALGPATDFPLEVEGLGLSQGL